MAFVNLAIFSLVIFKIQHSSDLLTIFRRYLGSHRPLFKLRLLIWIAFVTSNFGFYLPPSPRTIRFDQSQPKLGMKPCRLQKSRHDTFLNPKRYWKALDSLVQSKKTLNLFIKVVELRKTLASCSVLKSK